MNDTPSVESVAQEPDTPSAVPAPPATPTASPTPDAPPAPATLPTGITPERLTKLKQLCKARCSKDADPRTAARALYKTMREQFNQLKPATQDKLLELMERSLPTALQYVTSQPPAGLVDALCASITSTASATSGLTDSTPSDTLSPASGKPADTPSAVN